MSLRLFRPLCLCLPAWVLATSGLGCAESVQNQKKQVELRYVSPISVCRQKLAPVGNETRKGAVVRDLEPAQWLEVMVPGYNDEEGIAPTSLDCTGNYVFANESLRGGASDQGWPREVDPNDVVISSGPNGMRIVWLRSLKFESGEEGGPIALARAYGDNAEIYALGSFKGPKNTTFRTARVGNENIVMGESLECDPETETCRKRGHFFLPRRGRLLEASVIDLDRTTIVPSQTERGLYAEYKLSTDVTFESGGVQLLEQIQVRIMKTEVPDLDSDRPLRNVEFSRFLKIERDSMFSSNEPLWERVVGRD